MQISSDCFPSSFKLLFMSRLFISLSLLPSSPRSVEDKQKVAGLTHIPKYLPEITVGAHEYDEKYYAYRSVGGDDMFHSSLLISLYASTPSAGI